MLGCTLLSTFLNKDMVWDGRHYDLSFLHAVGNKSYQIPTSKTLNDKIVEIDNSLSQQNKNKACRYAKIFLFITSRIRPKNYSSLLNNTF